VLPYSFDPAFSSLWLFNAVTSRRAERRALRYKKPLRFVIIPDFDETLTAAPAWGSAAPHFGGRFPGSAGGRW
jgi:hypothetical protein